MLDDPIWNTTLNTVKLLCRFENFRILTIPLQSSGFSKDFPKSVYTMRKRFASCGLGHAYCRVKCTRSEIPRSQPGSKRRIGNAYYEKNATCFDTRWGPYRRRHWRTGNSLGER